MDFFHDFSRHPGTNYLNFPELENHGRFNLDETNNAVSVSAVDDTVEWLLLNEATMKFKLSDDFDGVIEMSTTHAVNDRPITIVSRSRLTAGMETESLFSAVQTHETVLRTRLGSYR